MGTTKTPKKKTPKAKEEAPKTVKKEATEKPKKKTKVKAEDKKEEVVVTSPEVQEEVVLPQLALDKEEIKILKTGVKALNGLGILDKKIKIVGANNNDIVSSFLLAIGSLTEEQESKLSNEVIEGYNMLVDKSEAMQEEEAEKKKKEEAVKKKATPKSKAKAKVKTKAKPEPEPEPEPEPAAKEEIEPDTKAETTKGGKTAKNKMRPKTKALPAKQVTQKTKEKSELRSIKRAKMLKGILSKKKGKTKVEIADELQKSYGGSMSEAKYQTNVSLACLIVFGLAEKNEKNGTYILTK